MEISKILNDFKNGKLSRKSAEKAVREEYCIDLDCAKIDVDRLRRTGVAEVIFGAGKTPEQIIEISKKLVEKFGAAMVTRVNDAAIQALKNEFLDVQIFPLCRIALVDRRAKVSSKKSSQKKSAKSKNFIAIVCAGTADLPVAQEAKVVAEFFGSRVETFADCGVAGLHRLLSNIEKIRKAKVVVAVAGMEGALPSVLAGLLKSPVIAVPTSVGYGANFGGLSALLAMMNSCANGVSVVNIDNGFGAGYNAHLINSL